MAGFDNQVMFSDNVDFRGVKPIVGQMVADGQLLIGATVAPHIRAATLTAGANVTITNGPGNIQISVTTGAGGIAQINGNTGSVTPVAGVVSIVGSGSLTTSGSGSTLTGSLTGLTNHAVLVGAGTATITKLSVGSNGQVLIGATAADPAFATLTSSDSSITFTTGANTLSLQVAGGTTVGKTITGTTGGALSPTAGNWNILGSSPAAGTAPVSTSGAASTLTVNVQKSQAIAATDATKIGLAVFDSAAFTVDANGFVSTVTSPSNGITTVGDVTSGHVAFDGTIGTTLTSTTAGLTLTAANNSGGTGAQVQLLAGPSSNSGSAGGIALVKGGSGNGAGNGGQVQITGGTPGATGASSGVAINGGNGGATSGQGGVITLTGGTGTGTNINAPDNLWTNSIGTGTGNTGHIIFKADVQGGVSGTTAHTSQPRLILNGFVALTSAAAATVVSVAIPSGGWSSGQIFYTIECTNGTDFQSLSGIVAYAFTSKAGTVTGTTSVLGTEAKNLTAGTLTTAWACNGSGFVQLTPTTSLTATTFRVIFQVMSGSQGLTTAS